MQMDEVMQRPDVVGVIAADPRGLCVASRGVVEPSQSGYVAELCQRCSKLAKDPATPPTIVLETDGGKPFSFIIKPMRNVCSGVLLQRKTIP